MNYNCGDADDDFGVKTESAVKLFQASNHLIVNSENNDEPKIIIESLMQS